MSFLGSKDNRILHALKCAVCSNRSLSHFRELELTAAGQEHMQMTFSHEDN